MERREEQPSSTDELAYGRPAEHEEHDRQPAGEPGGGQGAPDQAGSPRPGESGGAPMGPEGAGGPATAAPPPPVTTGPAQGDPEPQHGHEPAGPQHGQDPAAGGQAGAGAPGAEHGGEPAGPSAGAAATSAEPAPGGGHTAGANGGVPLLSSGDSDTFERRWQDIQVGFIDEPSRCVEQADTLVADVMKRLAEGFAEERKSLESQWSQGGEASTEDLRVALQRYRSFFNRLLSTSG